MTNNKPSRLDQIEQQLKRLKEPNANISMEDLKQRIAKLREEAVQRLEAERAAEQNAPKSADGFSDTEPHDSWQEESERYRAHLTSLQV